MSTHARRFREINLDELSKKPENPTMTTPNETLEYSRNELRAQMKDAENVYVQRIEHLRAQLAASEARVKELVCLNTVLESNCDNGDCGACVKCCAGALSERDDLQENLTAANLARQNAEAREVGLRKALETAGEELELWDGKNTGEGFVEIDKDVYSRIKAALAPDAPNAVMRELERITGIKDQCIKENTALEDENASLRTQLEAVTRERDAIRECFAEASHSAGPTTVHVERLTKERDDARAQLGEAKEEEGKLRADLATALTESDTHWRNWEAVKAERDADRAVAVEYRDLLSRLKDASEACFSGHSQVAGELCHEFADFQSPALAATTPAKTKGGK